MKNIVVHNLSDDVYYPKTLEMKYAETIFNTCTTRETPFDHAQADDLIVEFLKLKGFNRIARAYNEARCYTPKVRKHE